jgi:hypothetical protein
MSTVRRIGLKQLAISVTILLYASGALGQIAGELPVSTPLYRPAERIFQAAIASDGDGFLAVWNDQRDRGAVYAARIARDGTILDPRGVLLAKTLSQVAVAWIGDHYLVVWSGVSSVIAADIASDGHLLASPREIVPGARLSNARLRSRRTAASSC